MVSDTGAIELAEDIDVQQAIAEDQGGSYVRVSHLTSEQYFDAAADIARIFLFRGDYKGHLKRFRIIALHLIVLTGMQCMELLTKRIS